MRWAHNRHGRCLGLAAGCTPAHALQSAPLPLGFCAPQCAHCGGKGLRPNLRGGAARRQGGEERGTQTNRGLQRASVRRCPGAPARVARPCWRAPRSPGAARLAAEGALREHQAGRLWAVGDQVQLLTHQRQHRSQGVVRNPRPAPTCCRAQTTAAAAAAATAAGRELRCCRRGACRRCCHVAAGQAKEECGAAVEGAPVALPAVRRAAGHRVRLTHHHLRVWGGGARVVGAAWLGVASWPAACRHQQPGPLLPLARAGALVAGPSLQPQPHDQSDCAPALGARCQPPEPCFVARTILRAAPRPPWLCPPPPPHLEAVVRQHGGAAEAPDARAHDHDVHLLPTRSDRVRGRVRGGGAPQSRGAWRPRCNGPGRRRPRHTASGPQGLHAAGRPWHASRWTARTRATRWLPARPRSCRAERRGGGVAAAIRTAWPGASSPVTGQCMRIAHAQPFRQAKHTQAGLNHWRG